MPRHFLNKVSWHKNPNLSKILCMSLLITAFSFVCVLHSDLFFLELERKHWSSVLLVAHSEVLRSMMQWMLGSLWLNLHKTGVQSETERGRVEVETETRAGVLRPRWRRELELKAHHGGMSHPPGDLQEEELGNTSPHKAPLLHCEQLEMMTTLVTAALGSGHQAYGLKSSISPVLLIGNREAD